MEKLLYYVKNKNQGGARTTHQINQAFSLISYVIDLSVNRINEEKNDDNNSTNTNHTVSKKLTAFKEKHLILSNLNIQLILKKIIEIITENLKEEAESKENNEMEVENKEIPDKLKRQKEKELKKAKIKSKNLYSNLISFAEKFLLFLIKAGIEINNPDKVNKKFKSILNTLEKIAENNEMTNMTKKLSDLKEKAFTQVE